MGPMLSHVVDAGRAVKTGTNRVFNIPGNANRMAADGLEQATYNHLMKNAGDRAERLAYQQMGLEGHLQTGLVPNVPGTNQVAREANREILGNLRDATFQNLDTRAQRQAAIVPGAMRFAGNVITNPTLLGTGAGVAGTLGVGAMLEDQAQRQQLADLGLSPEEAELLSNEITMELQARAQAEAEAQAQAESERRAKARDTNTKLRPTNVFKDPKGFYEDINHNAGLY